MIHILLQTALKTTKQMCISNNQNVTLLTRNKNTAHAQLGTHKLHKMTTHRLQVVSSSRDDWNMTHVEHQCLCEYLGRFKFKVKSAVCHENHGWKCYLKCEKRDAIWAEDRCNAYVWKYLPRGQLKNDNNAKIHCLLVMVRSPVSGFNSDKQQGISTLPKWLPISNNVISCQSPIPKQL